MEFSRSDRIGAEMRRELAHILHDSAKDKRLSMVTVQEVRVTRDLSYAKVYYTVIDDSQLKQIDKALAGAAGYLRKRLGESMKIRTIPQLHFLYDKSIEEGQRLSALIDRAVAKDNQEQ